MYFFLYKADMGNLMQGTSKKTYQVFAKSCAFAYNKGGEGNLKFGLGFSRKMLGMGGRIKWRTPVGAAEVHRWAHRDGDTYGEETL